MSIDFIQKATEFSRDFELGACEEDELLTKAVTFLEEEFKETKEAVGKKDDAEILDGAGDVAFIALNMIYKWARINGWSHDGATVLVHSVMERICDANLGKKWADGEVKRNESGKVMKPEGWKPPQYEDIIQARSCYT